MNIYSNYNVFRQFNERLFKTWTGTIEWFDKDGFIRREWNGNVNIITIRLDDNGTRDSYNGHWVEITNSKNGSVHKKFFKFKDYIDFEHRDTQKFFHAWYSDNKLDWYISRPTTKGIENYLNALKKYIDLFN